MNENNIFAMRMKEARLKNEISQAELSRITGIAPATLSSYEKGKNPTIDKALNIANALGVSLDWICGNDIEENEPEKIQFSEIAKMLIFILKIDGISCRFAGKYEIVGDPLGYMDIYSEAVINFLADYNRIQSILEDNTYPQYLKDGLIKTIIDKYDSFYIEDGRIKKNNEEGYRDSHKIPF